MLLLLETALLAQLPNWSEGARVHPGHGRTSPAGWRNGQATWQTQTMWPHSVGCTWAGWHRGWEVWGEVLTSQVEAGVGGFPVSLLRHCLQELSDPCPWLCLLHAICLQQPTSLRGCSLFPPALSLLCWDTLSLWGYGCMGGMEGLSLGWSTGKRRAGPGDHPEEPGIWLLLSPQGWSLLGVRWPTPALPAHTKQVISCPPTACKEEEKFYLLFLWLLSEPEWDQFLSPVRVLPPPS